MEGSLQRMDTMIRRSSNISIVCRLLKKIKSQTRKRLKLAYIFKSIQGNKAVHLYITLYYLYFFINKNIYDVG